MATRKRKTKRSSNKRTRVSIRKGKLHPAKVIIDPRTGKMRVFVSAAVARKVNPGSENAFKAEIRTRGGGIFASGGFKTKAAARKWLSQYYSRGLLFGRSAFIVDVAKDKIVHEKHY